MRGMYGTSSVRGARYKRHKGYEGYKRYEGYKEYEGTGGIVGDTMCRGGWTLIEFTIVRSLLINLTTNVLECFWTHQICQKRKAALESV